MKKFISLLLVLAVVMAFAGCAKDDSSTTAPNTPDSTPGSTPASTPDTEPSTPATDPVNPTFDPAAKSEGVMTYAEYIAAELDTEVVVEVFVQANQSWWDNKITVYAQDPDGGYFLYNMACSEEDAGKLVPGTHIRVTGWKAEFSGEVEIVDATFEILNDGTWIADALDVTDLLGAENLADYMNRYVAVKGATVVAANEEGAAFLYKWNGAGSEGDDLYFNVSVNGTVYTFCVESYLCGLGSEAYEAVRNLKVGDIIDLEGFLYWYNGAQPHVTSVTVLGNPSVKSEGVMTYAEYIAAELDTEVVVEVFVQAHQSWWDNKITVYAQDPDGGYFLYNMACSEEDAAKLVPGTKIRVTGWKAEFSGEVEIVDATFEILTDCTWIAEATDVTDLLGAENLADYMNRYVAVKGATVVAANEEGAAFLYKWNGAGSEGDDLYFNVSVNGTVYTFCVESYLCGLGSEAYEAVRSLKVGDIINLEGFLYWYNGAQPHVTSVKTVG